MTTGNAFFDKINDLNPFYTPPGGGSPPNGLTAPVQNLQALQTPQPGVAQQQQGIPAPQQPPWSQGPGDGSWGAPDDRYVGAFASAGMKAPNQAQMHLSQGNGGGMAPTPMPPQRPAMQRPAMPQRAMPMQAPNPALDPNALTPALTQPNTANDPNALTPALEPTSRNPASYAVNNKNTMMKMPPLPEASFGSGPIANSVKPPAPSKAKDWAKILRNGPLDAASNPNAPGVMPW